MSSDEFFAKLDREPRLPARDEAPAKPPEGDASPSSRTPPGAPAQEPIDPGVLAERVGAAVAPSVARAMAEMESRRRQNEQPRQGAPAPRKPPSKPDKEKLLADESYLADYLAELESYREEVHGSARAEVSAEIRQLQERLDRAEAAAVSASQHAVNGSVEKAYTVAARKAIDAGLVSTVEEFDNLGQAIGGVMKRRIESGVYGQAAVFDPDSILAAANYAVEQLGVKPVRSRRKPAEDSIGAGDADTGRRRGEPRINETVWAAVEKRLGKPMPKEVKERHAREMASVRRVS